MDMNGMNAQPVFTEEVAPKKSKGLSITSMILGILALVLSCCVPYLPIFLSVAAIILAIMALAKKQGLKGMAIAGLICAIIALIPALITAIFGAALMAEMM